VTLAERYARGPAVALAAAKQAIQRGLEMDLEGGLLLERQAFSALFATEDQSIGMTSFVEKGPGRAEFVGR
jgi:enoyl-CoA hydratase/carnithine racemase